MQDLMFELYKNSATCLLCNTTIESKHVHDFVSCKCGNVFVDGGLDYIRRGYKLPYQDTIKDMIEYYDPETGEIISEIEYGQRPPWNE